MGSPDELHQWLVRFFVASETTVSSNLQKEIPKFLMFFFFFFTLLPEDRSRFLRFVTGRSRLPAPIYIFPDKQG